MKKGSRKEGTPKTKNESRMPFTTCPSIICVGNLPLKIKKKALLKEFSQFGEVKFVRLRSVPNLDILSYHQNVDNLEGMHVISRKGSSSSQNTTLKRAALVTKSKKKDLSESEGEKEDEEEDLDNDSEANNIDESTDGEANGDVNQKRKRGEKTAERGRGWDGADLLLLRSPTSQGKGKRGRPRK